MLHTYTMLRTRVIMNVLNAKKSFWGCIWSCGMVQSDFLLISGTVFSEDPLFNKSSVNPPTLTLLHL